MAETRRYEIDGMAIDIPIHYDELAKMYIEDYPDFKANPIYTPQGHPLTVCVEDACEFARATENEKCIECSECIYFKRATPKTWFGICTNQFKKKENTIPETEVI